MAQAEAQAPDATALYDHLLAAVASRDKKAVESILENNKGLNINYTRESDHAFALRIAVEKNDTEMAKLLLAHGADPQHKVEGTQLDQSPILLFLANAPMMEVLLDAGANAAATNGFDQTPLHLAASSRDLDKVSTLLRYGSGQATATAHDGQGSTPLMALVGGGEFDDKALKIAALLVRSGADINAHGEGKEGLPPLQMALDNINPIAVSTLLELGANPNALAADGQSALHLAIKRDLGIRYDEKLLEHSADIEQKNTDGQTPLAFALSTKATIPVVQYLLARGASLDAALTPDMRNIIESLRRDEAAAETRNRNNGIYEVTESSRDSLMEYIKRVQDGILTPKDKAGEEQELPTRPTKQAQDSITATAGNAPLKSPDALYAATREGNLAKVEELLASGADIRSRYASGGVSDTGLIHLAAESGNRELVDYLTKHGLDIDARDGLGRTPLLLAAKVGDPAMIAHLKALGADVNAKDTAIGFNAADYALRTADQRVVQAVIDAGSDTQHAYEFMVTQFKLHPGSQYELLKEMLAPHDVKKPSEKEYVRPLTTPQMDNNAAVRPIHMNF